MTGLNNLIYAPVTELQKEFRCCVPMQGARQLFLVDGGVQGTGRELNISIAEGETMKELLQIVAVRTDDSTQEIEFSDRFSFGKHSSGKILLCSHTFSHRPFKTHEKVSISVEEGACADFTVMQNEHNAAEHDTSFDIRIAAGGNLKMTFVTLHGGVISNTVTVSLCGVAAECELNGLYLMDGGQKVVNRIYMNHLVPECSSRQLFKGILDDKSSALFDGLIKVVQNAQKTEAYQANHHLLLSNEARAVSQPQLEIYADDVKCSHGATNGRLDEEQLFYLRSRGIAFKEAKLLQQMAFADEVLSGIPNETLRERMALLIGQRLRGEFSDCRNCSKNCC